jgi:hypothetical protein
LVFDILERLAPLPQRYDPHSARAKLPDPKKEKTLIGHVIECHARFVELKTDASDLRIDIAKTRRLLWVLIALAVGGNADTLGKIAAFIAN